MDAIDRKILAALQQDGRQTNAHLADAIGLSASATLERVRRLEQDGAIAGYRAIVAPEALGLSVQALIGVRLRVHARGNIEAFESRVAALRSLVSGFHATGQFDYVLRVAVRDLRHLREIIRVDLAALPGVAKLETMVVLSEVKRDAGWPIALERDVESATASGGE
ncbi:MAG TPA: Lrp/AsnC family transcriptional regulator [Thermoleophilia bacterium]|nr:Lrp/AsnC family transcriptional regulator [Thermoleophilia bacterium]